MSLTGQKQASLDGRYRAGHHAAAQLEERPWTCFRVDPAKPRRSATSIGTTKCVRGTAARLGRITDRFRIACSACAQLAVRCMAPTVPTFSSADVQTARAALLAYPSSTNSVSAWWARLGSPNAGSRPLAVTRDRRLRGSVVGRHKNAWQPEWAQNHTLKSSVRLCGACCRAAGAKGAVQPVAVIWACLLSGNPAVRCGQRRRGRTRE